MKPLHDYLDFFLLTASRGPFRLKHKTQGPSHIHIPKGKLLFRCLRKDGLPLQSKTGNHSHPQKTLLEVRREAKRPLLVGTVILVFVSIFTKSQASSPFEAMNSAHHSLCQKDVRPSVQKRWRIMAFSRVSTRDSVIPSSCVMIYESAFKPLQGNPAFI